MQSNGTVPKGTRKETTNVMTNSQETVYSDSAAVAAAQQLTELSGGYKHASEEYTPRGAEQVLDGVTIEDARSAWQRVADKVGTVGRKVLIGGGLTAAVLLTSACGNTGAKPPTSTEQPTETEKPSTLQGELDANMDKFNALERGSAEWDKYFAEFALPKASETDPKAIAEKFDRGWLVDLPLKIVSNAPGGGDDVGDGETGGAIGDWQFEGAKIGDQRNVKSLVETLQVEDHVRGFFDVTFGEDWENDASAKKRFEAIAPTVDNIVTHLLMDGKPNDTLTYELTSIKVGEQTDALLEATFKGYYTIDGEESIDVNGSSTFTVSSGRWFSAPKN